MKQNGKITIQPGLWEDGYILTYILTLSINHRSIIDTFIFMFGQIKFKDRNLKPPSVGCILLIMSESSVNTLYTVTYIFRLINNHISPFFQNKVFSSLLKQHEIIFLIWYVS